MSASEKVKALEHEVRYGSKPAWALLDVFPQIVAVVEAAEAERARDLVALAEGLPEAPVTEDYERWAQSPEARARDWALAALEEALP